MLIDLHAAAPHLDPAVADRAARAYTCEAQHSSRLLVADMSQTSTDRRLWVFDLRDPSRPVLIERTRVAHGAGSDPRKDSLIEYPSQFPIKVMGESNDKLVHEITQIAEKFDPSFDASTIELRPSSTGKYLGVTVTVTATSREQLDDLYRAFSSHPMVKVVL